MRSFKRQDRLRDQIKREVADILLHSVKNPKLGFVTITDVEVSRDLKYAKVFYSAMGSKIEKAESARALERTRKFVQSELGSRLKIRQTPVISYVIDKSLDYGERIDALLDQISKEGEENEQEDD